MWSLIKDIMSGIASLLESLFVKNQHQTYLLQQEIEIKKLQLENLKAINDYNKKALAAASQAQSSIPLTLVQVPSDKQ